MTKPFQRYQLHQGTLRPHDEGQWIDYADLETPLDDDLNVLLEHCEHRLPLSLAEQHELFDWLEEKDSIIGDMQEQLDKASEKKQAARNQGARIGEGVQVCPRVKGEP